MGEIYTIESQEATTYIDGGVPVSGYLITARIHKWNEIFRVNVPTLDSALINARLTELITQREALDKLGG